MTEVAMVDDTQVTTIGAGGDGPLWNGNSNEDVIPSDADVSLDGIQSAMNRVLDIGSCTHFVTLLAVGVCEERVRDDADEAPITPRRVESVRRQMSGVPRSTTAVRNSMNRLTGKGFVEKRDLEPGSNRRRFDWRLTDDGWRFLRVTNLVQFIRRIAWTDLDGHGDRSMEDVTAAVDSLADMDSMVHLPTLISIAVLEIRGTEPINGPTVVAERMRVDAAARSERSMYRSIDEVVEKGHVEKLDLEPDSNRTRFTLRLTEKGWRLLHTTGAIGMVREYVRLTDAPAREESDRDGQTSNTSS